MQLGESPTLVLSAYMPTQGSNTIQTYSEEIDILQALMDENSNLDLLILGDMNASITRPRPSPIDNALNTFISLNNLQHDEITQPTFNHHNMKCSSKIDYILFKDTNAEKPTNYQLLHSTSNTSSHRTISATLQYSITRNNTKHKAKVSAKKVKQWDKVNTQVYKEALSNYLEEDDFHRQISSPFDAAEMTAIVCGALKHAEKKAVPEKVVKLKGRTHKLPLSTVKALQRMKQLHARLKDEANPNLVQTIKSDIAKSRKEVRAAMRRARAKERDKLYSSLMSKPNDKTFHRMISFQRKGKGEAADIIIGYEGRELVDPCAQRMALTDHYAKLASRSENPSFDAVYLEKCSSALLFMSKPEFSCNDKQQIEHSIRKLNKNKAADLSGLKAEHLQACPKESAKLVARVEEGIKACGMLPETLSTGVVTSIGKKGKDTRLPANHRGISITSILGKALEHTEITIVSEAVAEIQSYLQFGFSAGQSPLGASVIITEAVAISTHAKQPLYIVTLDAQKAFDTVSHDILLHTLASSTELNTLHAATKLFYSGLSSQVKWKDECGERFDIQQGVRQGGILSTHLYKLYINALLDELCSCKAGFCTGPYYFGSPTCADDVVLLANSPEDLQAQLNIVERYASERRYTINASKSGLVISGHTQNASRHIIWTMNGIEIPILEEVVHLGLTRVEDGSAHKLIDDRIRKGRRTLYALIGTGVHGSNGVGIDKCLTVYLTYVLPVVMYGLESLFLTAKEEQELEKFHSQMVKHLQGLPIRTATSGAYLLAGILPFKALLDRARLSLMRCMIATAVKPEIHFLLTHGTARNISRSWTGMITHALALYELPLLQELLEHTPSKAQWKDQVSKAINKHWTSNLLLDATSKSTLSRMKPSQDGTRHPVWNQQSGCQAVREATIKARMLMGVYLLQIHRSRFNQFAVDATCMLCKEEDEDLKHFLAVCPCHERIRQFHIQRIGNVLAPLGITPQVTLAEPERFTQAILDYRLLVDADVKQPEDVIAEYEAATRHFCYELHKSRLHAVSLLEPRRRRHAATMRVTIRASTN